MRSLSHLPSMMLIVISIPTECMHTTLIAKNTAFEIIDAVYISNCFLFFFLLQVYYVSLGAFLFDLFLHLGIDSFQRQYQLEFQSHSNNRYLHFTNNTTNKMYDRGEEKMENYYIMLNHSNEIFTDTALFMYNVHIRRKIIARQNCIKQKKKHTKSSNESIAYLKLLTSFRFFPQQQKSKWKLHFRNDRIVFVGLVHWNEFRLIFTVSFTSYDFQSIIAAMLTSCLILIMLLSDFLKNWTTNSHN